MSEVLIIKRTTGPETLTWSGIGSASIGVGELPLNTPIELRELKVRLSIDESKLPAGDSLEDRKSDRSQFRVKTARQCFDEIVREYSLYDWQIVERRSEVAAPTAQDHALLGKTEKEIKSNYRRLIREFHPDKYATCPREIQELAHEKTVEVTNAYQRLTNGNT